MLAEAGEQRVAGRVAEGVVVLLEAVEVEEREEELSLAAGARQLDLEVVDQRAPVGEPGQRVGAGLFAAGGGHARVLAGQGLGRRAGEGRTAVEEHERHCEEEDHRRGARGGARVGRRRAAVVLAAGLVEGVRNAAHALSRNARQVIGALAVVGARGADLVNLVDRRVVGAQQTRDPCQRRHRRVAPQLGERRGDPLLAALYQLRASAGEPPVRGLALNGAIWAAGAHRQASQASAVRPDPRPLVPGAA